MRSWPTTPSAVERARLADALAAAGPDAPTLCAGWTTRDLAAHLVARERRPDAAAGIAVRPLAGWMNRVRGSYARHPYEELVELVRSGPPWTSPFALPGADRALNLSEHFVHCEDVLRGADADPPASPTPLDPAVREALWGALRVSGRALSRRAAVAVVLATPDGRERRLGSGPTVRLVGEPGELVLLACGRGSHALVRREGDDQALSALAAADLRM
jgi:uncharacterized protein (TIGR03085 family)